MKGMINMADKTNDTMSEITTNGDATMEDLAARALQRLKNNKAAAEEADAEPQMAVVDPTEKIATIRKTPPIVEDDDDDPVIISGGSSEAPKEVSVTDFMGGFDKDKYLPDMPEKQRETFLSQVRPEIESYRKSLIIDNGFTAEEAMKAAQNRLNRQAKEANDAYLEENPKVGVIEIDAKDEENFEVPKELEDKMLKVRALKLVVVENKELETLNIIKRDDNDENYRIKLFRGLNHSLSHYSIVLPCMGDYVTFNGAQSLALVSAASDPGESPYDSINKKAGLIYSQLYDGTCYHKFDETGKPVLTYEEFCRTFKADDIDMAVYAIAVASSMEVSEAPITCDNPDCKKDFTVKYNIKTLLSLEGVNKYYKDRITKIDENRNKPSVIQQLVDEHNQNLRFRSPVTNNVYTIGFPSIARALHVYEFFDATNPRHYGVLITALYLSEIFIYDEDERGYREVHMDDMREVMEILTQIPELDIRLINNQLTNRLYVPEFKFHHECPHCHSQSTDNISIDQLLFLKARDSSMEIR